MLRSRLAKERVREFCDAINACLRGKNEYDEAGLLLARGGVTSEDVRELKEFVRRLKAGFGGKRMAAKSVCSLENGADFLNRTHRHLARVRYHPNDASKRPRRQVWQRARCDRETLDDRRDEAPGRSRRKEEGLTCPPTKAPFVGGSRPLAEVLSLTTRCTTRGRAPMQNRTGRTRPKTWQDKPKALGADLDGRLLFTLADLHTLGIDFCTWPGSLDRANSPSLSSSEAVASRGWLRKCARGSPSARLSGTSTPNMDGPAL